MRKVLVAVAGIAAVAATPAFAQSTATADMEVKVDITNSCGVSATGMTFVAPTGIGGSNIDATSKIQLTCTIGANYGIEIGWGGHATGAGPTLQRNMAGTGTNTDVIPYAIYQDAGYSVPWGTGTANLSGTAAVATAIPFDAFGRIPSTASAVRADNYSDLVTVTVTF